jgi:hypothetical protein
MIVGTSPQSNVVCDGRRSREKSQKNVNRMWKLYLPSYV